MREHDVNKLDNFIAGWYSEDISICDDIINYFHTSPDRYPGHSYRAVEQVIDKSHKDSTDVSHWPDELKQEYFKILGPAVEAYKEKYPNCTLNAGWSIREVINIQHYEPGQGFHGWHSERASADYPSVSRMLVFMTYLNDVTDGGETEFQHQKLKIRPEKGLTIIWPSDWMFMHRGITSHTQPKTIVTGWFNFLNMQG